MVLAPLGFRSNLLQRSPLGQSVQFLQPLTPLGQSVSPLGQTFQPLHSLPPLSPFVQAALQEVPSTASSEPWMFSEFDFSNTKQAIAPDANRIPDDSQKELRSDIDPNTQPSLLQTQVDSDESAKEPLSPKEVMGQRLHGEFGAPPDHLQTAPAFDTPAPSSPSAEGKLSLPEQTQPPTAANSVRENLAQLKPLGALPPLAQESDFLIPAPPNQVAPLPQPIAPEARNLSSEAAIQPLSETQPGLAEVASPQSPIDSPSVSNFSEHIPAEPETPQSEQVQSAEDNLSESTNLVEPTIQRIEDTLSSSISVNASTEDMPTIRAERRPIAFDQDAASLQQEDSSPGISETLQPSLDQSSIEVSPSDIPQDHPTFSAPPTLPEQASTERSQNTAADSLPHPPASEGIASEIALKPQEPPTPHPDSETNAPALSASNPLDSVEPTLTEPDSLPPLQPTSKIQTEALPLQRSPLVQPAPERLVDNSPESFALSEPIAENQEVIQPSNSSISTEMASGSTTQPDVELKNELASQIPVQEQIQTAVESASIQSQKLVEPQPEISSLAGQKAAIQSDLDRESKNNGTASKNEQTENNVDSRENFQLLDPLGASKPLIQASDLLMSPFQNDVEPAEILQSRSETSSDSNVETNQTGAIAPANLRASESTTSSASSAPDSWSNIAELLGENSASNIEPQISLARLNPIDFSQPLNPTSENLGLPSTENDSEAPRISRQSASEKTSMTQEQASSQLDASNSWSSISELLSKRSIEEANFSFIKDEKTPIPLPDSSSSLPADEAPSITLTSPTIQAAPLTSTPPSSQSSIDDKQLEQLAHQVYSLMRSHLDLDLERLGKGAIGYPTWPKNALVFPSISAKPDANTQKPNSTPEVSAVDSATQQLAYAAYRLVQQRIEIEQERRGRAYAGRFS